MYFLEEAQAGGVRTKPRAYWVNTSNDALFRGFVGRATPEIRNGVAVLLEGGTVAARPDAGISCDQTDATGDVFWTLLLQTGYLTGCPPASDAAARCVRTPRPGETVLTIPNREVRGVFAKEMDDWIGYITTDAERRELLNRLMAGDAAGFEAAFGGLMTRWQGVHPFAYGEDFHRVLLRGLLLPCGNWGSDGHAGPGASALRVVDKEKKRVLVLGLRVVESEDRLDAGAEEALGRSAEEKDDAEPGTILRWGVAFCATAYRVKALRA